MNTYISSRARWLLFLLLLATESCWAGTSSPVDLGGLILWGGVYLVGLVALVIAVPITGGNNRVSMILVVYIGIPIILYSFANYDHELAEKKRIEDRQKFEEGEKLNLEAFGKYCKERKRIIHAKVKPEESASLVVRIDSSFTGIKREFNGFSISRFMQNRTELCARSGLKYVEELYDGGYSEEKKGQITEVRRYLMCSSEKPSLGALVQSRYELILGEKGSKNPVHWGGEWGRWMSNSSVRIVDRTTGETLAEDAMYFLRHETGESGCPSGFEQLAELIVEVFGKQ